MFPIMLKYIAIAVFLWQFSSAEVYHDPFSWCNCMQNPSESKQAYEKLYNEYWDLSNHYLQKVYKALSTKVKAMNEKDNDNKYYDKDLKDMTYEAVKLCHIPYLKDDFEPFWTNKNVSDKEVCDWLSTSGKVAEYRMDFNRPLILTSDFVGVFERVIEKNWKQASAGVDSCKA